MSLNLEIAERHFIYLILLSHMMASNFWKSIYFLFCIKAWFHLMFSVA